MEYLVLRKVNYDEYHRYYQNDKKIISINKENYLMLDNFVSIENTRNYLISLNNWEELESE